MKTIQLFNARSNATEDAELSYVEFSGNKEYHATFADGHVVKFPFTTNKEELSAWIAKHNEHNTPAITAESLEQSKSEAEAFLSSL